MTSDKFSRMSTSSLSSDPVRGRREKLHRIAAGAVEQSGKLVVIEGLSGMGKTTMLSELAEHMQARYAWKLTHARADRVEQYEPFSFIERLFAGDLVPGWSLDLRSNRQPIAIARECLDHLFEGTNEEGRLVIIDDAQWIDEPSGGVLRFLLPRMIRRNFLVAFGVRTPHAPESFVGVLSDLADTPCDELIQLEPLTDEDIRALAIRRFDVGISRRNAENLRRVSGGSFFLVDTILANLRDNEIEQLHSTWEVPIRGTRPQENPLLVQYESLSGAGRTAADIVCVADFPLPKQDLIKLANELDEPLAIEEAEQSEVIRESGFGTLIEPRHSLMAAAVQHALPERRFREISKALADVTIGYPAINHSLAGATSWSTDLGERLNSYLDTATESHSFESADTVLRRALELANERAIREDLLIRLAMVHLRARTAYRLQDLLPEYEQLPDSMLREFLLILLSAHRTDTTALHERILRFQALPAAGDDATTMQAFLGLLMVFGQLRMKRFECAAETFPEAIERFERAPRDPDTLNNHHLTWLVRPDEYALLLECYRLIISIRKFDFDPVHSRIDELLERVRALPDGENKAEALVPLAGSFAAFGDYPSSLETLGEALRAIGASAGPIKSSTMAIMFVHCLTVLGEFDGAAEIMPFVEDLTYDSVEVENRPKATALSTIISAVTGSANPSPYTPASPLRLVNLDFEGYSADLPIMATCELARANQDARAIVEATQHPRIEELEYTQKGFLTFRAHALIDLGRLDEAESLLTQLARERGVEWHECWGSLAWLRARMAEARGQVDEALSHYKDACQPTPYVLPLALTLADYGSFLSRLGRVKESRAYLQQALEKLQRCGAQAYVPRVRRVLAAVEEDSRNRSSQLLSSLTRREVEVMHRLADGESNSKIAESLFVSTATARFHVSNVLRKLDITSRAEVSRVLRDAAMPDRGYDRP